MTDHLTKYQLLDELEMILLRPDTFVGSVEPKLINSYIFDDVNTKPVWRDVTYSPALLKLFDEVLQNTYDQSKRPEGANLNRIDVNVNHMSGLISVQDNSGIPVEIHPEHNVYIADMLFGMLRSSSNYDDTENRQGGGRNGLGAKLTNIFSTFFNVETCDGKKKYTRTYGDNMGTSTDAKISGANVKSRGTKISFIPDYERLKCSLDKDNYGMIVTRVYEIAACSPHIDVYLNGTKVDVKGFKTFVEKFDSDAIYVDNSHWRIGVLPSDSGFKHVSFVNATHTWIGGTHVEYLADQIVEGVRDHIKKKTKQDIKPAELKSHFFLMIDCTVFNPRFNSQTKDFMNLAIKDYGTTYRFDEKFFKKLIKSPIIQDIIEWANNRKAIQDLKDLKALNKDKPKNTLKKIKKYEGASQKNNREDCMLFICEGDSAFNPLISSRDPKLHGVFAMRGKGLRLATASPEQIKKNVEIQDLTAAIGLIFKTKPDDLRYGKLVISTDADQDGMHIRAIILDNFKTEWPDLLKDGRVFYLRTPIVRVVKGKDTLEFFTEQEFEEWRVKQPPTSKMDVKFLKGLGGNSTKDFKKYMYDDKYIIPLTYEDEDDVSALNLAFGEADDKKVWLDCEDKDAI